MMDKKIGERSYYGYDDICRSWSQRQFKSAPGQSATPPERKGAITTMGVGHPRQGKQYYNKQWNITVKILFLV
jgi:hypothetical protein